jgi:hypothetical protein
VRGRGEPPGRVECSDRAHEPRQRLGGSVSSGSSIRHATGRSRIRGGRTHEVTGVALEGWNHGDEPPSSFRAPLQGRLIAFCVTTRPSWSPPLKFKSSGGGLT